MLKALKKLFKIIIFHPFGMSMPSSSVVKIPRNIINPKKISIGNRTYIGPFSQLNAISEYVGIKLQGQICIGSDVHIGGHCQIHAMQNIVIEDGVVLSEYVYISDASHGNLNPLDGLIMKQPLMSKGIVRIKRGVFVGYGAAILPGVILDEYCVVAARSVVTHSFPAYSMVAGSPARLIKTFDHISAKWVSVSTA